MSYIPAQEGMHFGFSLVNIQMHILDPPPPPAHWCALCFEFPKRAESLGCWVVSSIVPCNFHFSLISYFPLDWQHQLVFLPCFWATEACLSIKYMQVVYSTHTRQTFSHSPRLCFHLWWSLRPFSFSNLDFPPPLKLCNLETPEWDELSTSNLLETTGSRMTKLCIVSTYFQLSAAPVSNVQCRFLSTLLAANPPKDSQGSKEAGLKSTLKMALTSVSVLNGRVELWCWCSAMRYQTSISSPCTTSFF